MGLEVAAFVSDLVPSNPDGTDGKAQGDNHIRLVKQALKGTLPNANRPFYFPSSMSTQVSTVTVVAADAGKHIPVDATGGAFVVNLPDTTTIWEGFEVNIVKTDNTVNLVTIDGNGADPINGGLTVALAHQYQAFKLVWCASISSWLAYRSEAAQTVDATLTLVNNVLSRAALTGAVVAAGGSNATTQTIDLVVVIGDAINVITTGVKGYVPIDFAGTITGWTLVADVVGSCVLDVWKDTYANFPPTDADRIAGTEKPTLAAVQKNQDLTLTTWTTAVAAGDVLGFEVESAATVKQVTLVIRMTKTS